MSHLIRVSLPDVPGSLGAVASALGAAGVNIEAIEIVEHGDGDSGRAIDDVFISLGPGRQPDEAVSAILRLDGVEVLWVSRYPTAGNLSLDLEAIERTAEEPHRAIEVLTELVPRTFRGDWALVLERTDSQSVVLKCATPGAPEPVAACTTWLPITQPARIESPPEWGATVLGATPLGGPDRMIVLGRNGGPPILDSELARFAHLAVLASSIGARSGR